jgi:hypothetical protein
MSAFLEPENQHPILAGIRGYVNHRGAVGDAREHRSSSVASTFSDIAA